MVTLVCGVFPTGVAGTETFGTVGITPVWGCTEGIPVTLDSPLRTGTSLLTCPITCSTICELSFAPLTTLVDFCAEAGTTHKRHKVPPTKIGIFIYPLPPFDNI